MNLRIDDPAPVHLRGDVLRALRGRRRTGADRGAQKTAS
jgi:hypothetical protein